MTDEPASAVTVPGWLRALELIAGVILIIAAFLVWVHPMVAILAVETFFAIALIFLGFARLLGGITAKNLNGGLRALMVLAGVILLMVGIVALVFPVAGVLTLVYFFAIALLFAGIERLAAGGMAGTGPAWIKYLTLAIAVLVLIISFAILVFPAFGLELIFLLISVQLLLLGIELLAAGITGKAIPGINPG
ncbi:MAG: DUF308 domain-containing protein [Methanolinea sp.]|nr:DUF308 domain-containing protein [Methanolinea sp.]